MLLIITVIKLEKLNNIYKKFKKKNLEQKNFKYLQKYYIKHKQLYLKHY